MTIDANWAPFWLFVGLMRLSKAYCCTENSYTYKRNGEDVELNFQAVTTNRDNPELSIFNIIFSPYDSQMLSVLYKKGNHIYTSDCHNCTFIGDVAQGNIAVRVDNLQNSKTGTYKHAVDNKDTVLDCVSVFILGVPTKPNITKNKDPSVGENVILTCSSTSTTFPSSHNLHLIYTWRFDGKDNPDDPRYSYSTNKRKLTLINVVKSDASKRFTCTAKEDVDNAITSLNSDSFSFNVLYGPENVDFSPRTTNYERYENTTLVSVTCSASCNPACSFKWTKVGDDTFVRNSAVLSLGMLSRSMAGTYRCIAIRTGGSDVTKNLTVNVIYTDVQSFYIKEHHGQENVTVDEHDGPLEFICNVYSNTAPTTKIIFEGIMLNIGVNVTSLSFTRQDVSCHDTGAYKCEGKNVNGITSIKKLFMAVRCVPRPRGLVRRNISCELYAPMTLSFTAIAYPKPGPKGFAWHKEEDGRWVQLLSNDHLKISSSELQSNLTVLKVSKEDYGKYMVTVTNDVGSYVQYFLLSEITVTTQAENPCQHSDQKALIVGISLGLLCCVLASYATYLTVLRMRTARKGARFLVRSKKQPAYANPSFASDAVGRQEYENTTLEQRESSDQQQYTDLCRYANTDKDTYDVIKKI